MRRELVSWLVIVKSIVTANAEGASSTPITLNSNDDKPIDFKIHHIIHMKLRYSDSNHIQHKTEEGRILC
jgi:hypothetical protein